MDKVVAVKTNSFWVLLHFLCSVNALMNLVAFEFVNVLLVKSTETGPNVFFIWASCWNLSALLPVQNGTFVAPE